MTAPHLDPRSAPVDCLYDAHWARRLKAVGYANVGHVIDATPEVLARNVFGVGPKRAVKLQQKALDFVASKTSNAGKIVMVEGHYDPTLDEVTPTLWDALLTVGSLLAIGALGTLTIWWLLQ